MSSIMLKLFILLITYFSVTSAKPTIPASSNTNLFLGKKSELLPTCCKNRVIISQILCFFSSLEICSQNVLVYTLKIIMVPRKCQHLSPWMLHWPVMPKMIALSFSLPDRMRKSFPYILNSCNWGQSKLLPKFWIFINFFGNSFANALIGLKSFWLDHFGAWAVTPVIFGTLH